MMLDAIEGRIWATHHQAFSDWAGSVAARIGATLRRDRTATLLSAVAAIGLSALTIGGSLA